MQIVSLGDNLHEVSDPIFKENKKREKIICLSSAESAHGMVSVDDKQCRMGSGYTLFAIAEHIWVPQDQG